MTLWMLWATGVTALLALAALAAESVLRSAGRQTRWVWVLAVGAVFALQAWSLLKPAEVVVPIEVLVATVESVPVPVIATSTSVMATVREWAGVADGVLGWAWAVATPLLLLLLAVGVARLRLRMRRWSRAKVAGEEVLLSESFGPALVGVVHPRIVVPRWALALDSDRLRMTFMHEGEHRAARDTLLLLGASVASALNPWNVAMWWAVWRLRQSVEMDCDRRVLSRGISRTSYGTLLIDLSAATSAFRLPVAALANRTSLLERRLKMMNVMNRVDPLRAIGAVGVAVLLTLAACETPAPSALSQDGDPAAQRDQANIESLAGGIARSLGVGQPLVVVDGEEVGPMDRADLLDDLDPDLIERVEILKGAAAQQFYGEKGINGVVVITTKVGAAAELDRELEAVEFDRQLEAVELERRRAVEMERRREIEETELERRRRAGEEVEPGVTTLGGLARFEDAEVRSNGLELDRADQRIRLRPDRSLEGVKLYVDGVEVESFEDIHPDDIARFEVQGSEGNRSIYVFLKG